MTAAEPIEAETEIHHEVIPCGPPREIRYHTLCTKIPAATRAAVKQRADDIAKNGLLEPITLLKGRILDGRTRQDACLLDVVRKAGVKPRYQEYVGNAPAAYVASKNLERRDLTPSQRAAAAAALLPTLEKEAAARQKTGRAPDVSAHGREGDAAPAGKAAEIAAKAAGVGTRTVERAKRVQETGEPELVEAMREGGVSVRAAEDISRLSREEQLRAIGMSENEIKVAVGAIRRRRAMDSASSSESNEWYTPARIVEPARSLMGGVIRLDPASCAEANETVLAERFLTEGDDGLVADWEDGTFFNPPYGSRAFDGKVQSNQSLWTQKAIRELLRGHRSIGLVSAYPAERWFQPLTEFARCWPTPRVRFNAPNARIEGDGKKPDQPRASHVVVNFGYDPFEFADVYQDVGHVDIPVIHVADSVVSKIQAEIRNGEDGEWSRRLGEIYVNKIRAAIATEEATG